MAPPIPNPKYPDIIPLDRDPGFVECGDVLDRIQTQFSVAPETHTRLVLAGIGGVGYVYVCEPITGR